MAYNNNAAVSPASRILFAPLFRARWQNMQNIVNDSAFIEQIPPAYKTYYITYISQWLQWSRGFVPQLHSGDFFSTGIGYTVCDIITKECMSGGYRLHSADNATKEFAEKWCKDDLNNIINKMFFQANAGGNAILVLTPVDGELYPSVYPINRVVYQIGRTGKISDIILYNRFVAGETSYYTREYRKIIDGVAYWRVILSAGTDMVTVPEFRGGGLVEVPDIIKTQWEYCYGNIKPNEWYTMPEHLHGVGCYNVKNKAVAVALADLPGYSDSTLHTALDVLYSIDYNYTQAQVDQYMGKSRAIVPKQMGGIRLINQPKTLSDGMSFRDAINTQLNPLDDLFYSQLPSENLNGGEVKPMFIQPDLRAEQHKFIRDADLELLAAKVGLSASTLATHLSAGGGTKTDDEITQEGSVTEKTVGNKRQLAATAINAMLTDVAHFYGYSGDVEIRFGRTTSNSARENAELLADYNAGTLPLRDYLRKRWTDMGESDIEKMAQELEAKEKERAMQNSFGKSPFDDTNYFGGES